MGTKVLPSVAYLRQRLRYEPDTGKLYWREFEWMPRSWLARYANTEAFISRDTNGYPTGCIDEKRYSAHRVIWALYYGKWPDGEIDHIDHDRENNRIENLRIVSHQENKRNLSRRKDNISGATGVHWSKAARKWVAYIRVDKIRKHLGYFDNFEDAVFIRKKSEAENGFHERHGR